MTRRAGLLVIVLLSACGASEDGAERGRPFPDLVGMKVLVGSVDGETPLRGRSVFLVFAPEQCHAALRVIERFNALHETGSDPSLVGIVYTPYRLGARKALKAYDVRFPVLYDSLATVKEALGIYAEPALFLVEEGRIVTSAHLGTGDVVGYRRIMAAAGGS